MCILMKFKISTATTTFIGVHWKRRNYINCKYSGKSLPLDYNPFLSRCAVMNFIVAFRYQTRYPQCTGKISTRWISCFLLRRRVKVCSSIFRRRFEKTLNTLGIMIRLYCENKIMDITPDLLKKCNNLKTYYMTKFRWTLRFIVTFFKIHSRQWRRCCSSLFGKTFEIGDIISPSRRLLVIASEDEWHILKPSPL